MKVKVSELQGPALDWAVAKCEFPAPDYGDEDRLVYVMGDDEFHFAPSTDWAQGGPIIERGGIAIYPDSALDQPDIKWSADAEDALRWGGPTPLIAAMRCFVVSKLGDEVDVPEELI